jgi:NADPH:quinone reductase-like Zn-dependent oxidoreductase
MVKVARVHALTGLDGLAVDEIEVPAPGPGEVRIEVAAIGLNRAETMVLYGGFGEIPLPSKIGYEAAGTIESLGEGVSGFSVGDRVAALPGLQLHYGTCGEEIVVPADMLVKTPDGQSDLEAAATWMQYLTAYAVRAYRPIHSGDAVIITAASSSVGLAAIQIVNADGGVPIAVTRGRAKADALRRHGAAHVIVSDEEDVAARVQDITGGQGAALAFDAVAGQAFPALLMSLRIGGLAIVYGGLGGEPSYFSGTLMAFRDLSIQGFATNYLVADPKQRDEAVAYVRERIANGTFAPVIDRTFGLADVADAYRYLESNRQVGKIVVTV